jgi:hypothetical protein
VSKLIDQVQAKLTGQRVALMPELTVTEKVEDVFDNLSVLQYDIGVEWKIRTHCDRKDVPHVLKNVVRQLREEIYGEFRRRALEIQRAAYEREYEKMHMLIRDMLVDING